MPQWQPHRYQQEALDSVERFLCLVAGVRGGKTWIAAHVVANRIFGDLYRARQNGERWTRADQRDGRPLRRYWVVAPVYDLLEQSQTELSSILHASGWRPRFSEKYKDIHKTCWLTAPGVQGTMIEFKSADRDALVSVSVHGAWMDEAARMKSSAWAGGVRGRLTDTAGWCVFSTSPTGTNWLHEQVFARGAGPESSEYDPTKYTPSEFKSILWPTSANPHPLIQADVAKAKRDLPRRYWVRDYEASFREFQGQVYEEFASDHIIDDVGRFDEVIGGVDFGHSAPGCVLVVGVRRRFAPNGKPAHRYHALAEVYADRWVTSQWIAAAQKLCTSTRPQITTLYCDPAGAQLIADWKNAGLPVATHPSINDVSSGIRHVATLFAQGRLTVSPKCVNLIRELRAYRYREDSAGNTIDVVVKANDHAPDAARYALFADHLRHAA